MEAAVAGAAGIFVGGVGSSAKNVFDYNRASWLADVLMVQARHLNKNGLLLSLANMFREDIRDIMASANGRQQNFIIVNTLVLGLVLGIYANSEDLSSCSPFVAACYQLSVGTSTFFVIMATACSIYANNITNKVQRRMLLTKVRLPIETLIMDVYDDRGETVESFEHQDMRQVLRLPFLSRLIGRQQSAMHTKREDEGRFKVDSSPQIHPFVPDDTLINVKTMLVERERHMRTLQDSVYQLDMLTMFSLLFLIEGMRFLLQGYGYDRAGRAACSGRSFLWILQVLVVLIDAFIGFCVNAAYMTYSPRGNACQILVTAFGQVFAVAALWQGDTVITRLLVPLVFILRLGSTIGFLCMTRRAADWVIEKSDKEASTYVSTEKTDCDLFSDSSTLEEGVPSPERHAPERQTVLRHKVLGSVMFFLFGIGVVTCLPWVFCVGWFVFTSEGYNFAHLNESSASTRRLRAADGARSFEQLSTSMQLTAPMISELNVEWSSVHFKPLLLACSVSGSCVVTNDFVAYRFSATQSDRPSGMIRLDCNFSGRIVDVACRSDGDGHCSPVILTHSLTQPLVDCATMEISHLKHDLSLPGLFAIGVQNLFAVHSGSVIQYSQSRALSGDWTPLWSVAEVQSNDLVDVVAVGSELLLFFHASGTIQLRSLKFGTLCRTWTLPFGIAPLQSGTLLEQSESGQKANVLLLSTAIASNASKRSNPRLWRVDLPRFTCEAVPGNSDSFFE